jgi:hypothetical protein
MHDCAPLQGECPSWVLSRAARDGWFYLLLLRCVPAGICTRIVLGSTIAGTAKIAVWPSDVVHSIGTLCICGTDGAGEDTCCEDEGFHFWLLGL